VNYRIEIKRGARKQLASMAAPIAARIASTIDALAADPRPSGCRKLAGTDRLYRVRVGDYRVVYEIHDDRLLVLVIKLGHRREVYR
jgi:mRNA interferase RelE/StbE